MRCQESPVTGSAVSLWDRPRLVRGLEVIRDDRIQLKQRHFLGLHSRKEVEAYMRSPEGK